MAEDNTSLDIAPGRADNRDKTQKIIQSAAKSVTDTVTKVDGTLKITQTVSTTREMPIVKNAEKLGTSAFSLLGSVVGTAVNTAAKVVESTGVDVQGITEKITHKIEDVSEQLDERFEISERIEKSIAYMKPPDSARRFVLLNLEETTDSILQPLGGKVVPNEMDVGFTTWKIEESDALFFNIDGNRPKFWNKFLNLAPAILYILNGGSEEMRAQGLAQFETISRHPINSPIFILLKTDGVTDITEIMEKLAPRDQTYIAITRTDENTRELINELLSSDGGLFGWIPVPKPAEVKEEVVAASEENVDSAAAALEGSKVG